MFIMERIITRREHFGIPADGPVRVVTALGEEFLTPRRAIERTFEEWALRQGTRLPDWRRPRKEAVIAYVNHNRWIADCLNCPSAELVDPQFPVFYCTSCGGGPWSVQFPPPEERAAAEKLLLERPPAHRNWWPQRESIDDLAAENRTYVR